MADQRPGVPDHNAFPQPGCPPGLVVDDRPLPPANPWDDDYRSVELAEEDADCLVL